MVYTIFMNFLKVHNYAIFVKKNTSYTPDHNVIYK